MNLVNLQEAANFFIIGFLELSVLFLGVSLLVEIINVFMNPEKVKSLLSSKKSGYMIASSLGAMTPFCSCSTVPLTMGLLKSKAGFGPIMTFLFTSPLLNPIIIVVFYVSFGFEITFIYALTAFTMSLLAGYTLEKFGFEKYIKTNDDETSSCGLSDNSCNTIKVSTFTTVKNQPTSCCTSNIESDKSSEPISSQIKTKVFNKQILLKTWKQFMDFVPYIAIGIGIGAFVHGFVPEEVIVKYAGADNIFAVPFSALIGVPLYIRAETMVGLAPELIDKGVNMGSILALTIAGAGASLPEMIMLKKIFKLPIMLFFVLAVFTMAIGCGYIVNLYFV